jgi:myosin heavy subunit
VVALEKQNHILKNEVEKYRDLVEQADLENRKAKEIMKREHERNAQLEAVRDSAEKYKDFVEKYERTTEQLKTKIENLKEIDRAKATELVQRDGEIRK